MGSRNMSYTRILQLFCLLIFFASLATATTRSLKVIEFPAPGGNLSASVPYDPSYPFPPNGDADIPMDLLAHQGEEFSPDQVHLMLWSPTSMMVSWATGLGRVNTTSSGAEPYDADAVPSVVQYGVSPESLDKNVTAGNDGVKSKRLVYKYEYAAEDGPIDGEGTVYHSPIIHHVILESLEPGQNYYYSVGSEEFGFSDIFNFTQPKNGYPFTFGVLSDVGQTYNSSTTLNRTLNAKPDAIILTGDLSYADDWQPNGTSLVDSSYQPKWDTWGRLAEPLISHVPHISIHGNHETESIALMGNATNLAYNARYPNPQNPDVINTDPNYAPLYWDQSLLPDMGKFLPEDVSDKVVTNNTWYSIDVGPAHVVMLNNYVPYSNSSEMYKWFEADMEAVDRTKTPWLIIGFHAPWYSSYENHYKENAEMQQFFEPLFLKYSVDIVFNGHVHAYDRSPPVYSFEPNTCGPIYMSIGDGGNVEGLYREFVDGPPVSAFCGNTSLWAPASYQPSYTGDGYIDPNTPFCYQSQPPWSDYRDPSFGHGVLTLVNETTARWQWNKNVDKEDTFKDDIFIKKNPSAECTNRVVEGTSKAANANALPYEALPTDVPPSDSSTNTPPPQESLGSPPPAPSASAAYSRMPNALIAAAAAMVLSFF